MPESKTNGSIGSEPVQQVSLPAAAAAAAPVVVTQKEVIRIPSPATEITSSATTVSAQAVHDSSPVHAPSSSSAGPQRSTQAESSVPAPEVHQSAITSAAAVSASVSSGLPQQDVSQAGRLSHGVHYSVLRCLS